MKANVILWVVLSILLATPAARANPTAAETTLPASNVDRMKVMWRLELGYRGNFVTDAGLNPFSTQDYLGQISMSASRTIFARGRLSFAPGIAWDYGRTGATARGDATSLEVHRLSVPLEARAHFGRWGYVFLRAAPGVAIENVEVDDSTALATLTKNRWLFATDLSAGYAYPVWSRAEAGGLTPRLWFQSDGGYGWVVAQRLNLGPDLSSGDPRLASGVDLGSLSMRGAFFRVAAAASF